MRKWYYCKVQKLKASIIWRLGKWIVNDRFNNRTFDSFTDAQEYVRQIGYKV